MKNLQKIKFNLKFIKEKAGFMILILICSIFYFGLGAEKVEAQSTKQKSTGQKACCEVTKSGDSCVYTERSQCDTNFKNSLTTCENTNYCSVGTCIYDKEGECFGNTPKSLCGKTGGVWSSEDISDIKQCQKGCCQLSNECSFVTQTKCKSETSKFPFVKTIFDSSIESEAQCIDKCRSEEKGACVSSDGNCVFTTRNSCNEESEKVLQNNNETKISVKSGFHVNVLCSNPLLGTNCARQQKTNCFNEDVYWFDSCGNPENIYSSDKDKSYNKGFILEESKSCVLNGANDPSCGNCDYSKGNLCGKAEEVAPKFGEFICKDLTCKQTTTNKASPDSAGEKQTGESWCLYDARVGFGQDVVGSRHYRSLCLNGEEVIEPCKDYREEFCVQGVSGAIPNFNLGQLFNVGKGYLESACRENRYQECNSCNSATDVQGCCNDIENKDCYFLAAGITEKGGICIPMVPPGLRFWESGSSGQGSEGGTQTGASSVCSEGSTSCEVKWVRGGTARFGIGGLGTETDWTCVKNCQCLEPQWIKAAATQCVARGDCGPGYNIVGKFSSGGFTHNTKFSLTERDFEDWSTLSRQNMRGDDPTNLGAFFGRTWPALFQIIGPAIVAGFVTYGLGGAGISAFGSALILGPKTLLTPFPAYTTESVFLEAFRGGVRMDISLLNTNQVSTAYSDANGVEMFYGAAKEGEATKWLLRDPQTKQILGEATDAQVAATSQGAIEGFNSFFVIALEVLSILAWLYTIYSLIDYFGKEDKKEIFTATCSPWVAPAGGSDCEKCNEKGKTCSEYRCRSLGKLCRLINEGTSDEKCVAQTPRDTNSPVISAIKPKDLNINEEKNKGFVVTNLIKPFTPVELKISTDEPAICKFDLKTGIKFDDMKFSFGDSIFKYNHTMLFSLPSELQEESALKLTNGGKYDIYARCKDFNENANTRDYYIKFEIDKGPDLTAPKIELTSIKNNGFISSETNEILLDIFVNEPSECKFDKNDIDYELMSNNFICKTSSLDLTPINQGLYRCTSLLKGLNKGKNIFFFRCKDKPGEKDGRNVNKEGFKFELIKTEKLEIISVEPKGKVFQANPKLSARTSKGAENGVSICGYSTNKNSLISNIPLFSKTNSTEHLQQLRDIRKGSYTFFVTCVDKAGNIAIDSTQFNVAAESNLPLISRVYKDIKNNVLVIGTNEDSSCEYDVKEFTFGEGIKMTDPNTKKHEASLTNNIYYVKCNDVFNNQGSVIVFP